MTYGVRSIGMSYERMLFGMKISDASCLAKAIQSTDTLSSLVLQVMYPRLASRGFPSLDVADRKPSFIGHPREKRNRLLLFRTGHGREVHETEVE